MVPSFKNRETHGLLLAFFLQKASSWISIRGFEEAFSPSTVLHTLHPASCHFFRFSFFFPLNFGLHVGLKFPFVSALTCSVLPPPSPLPSSLFYPAPRPHLQVHLFPLPSPSSVSLLLLISSLPPHLRVTILIYLPHRYRHRNILWAGPKRLGKKELERTRHRGKKESGGESGWQHSTISREIRVCLCEEGFWNFSIREAVLSFLFFPCFIHTVGKTLGTGNLRITNTEVETYHRHFLL